MIENAEGMTKSLIIFLLSTGAHPSVITEKQYHLDLSDKVFYAWNRPKTDKEVKGRWSKAMSEESRISDIKKFLRKKKGNPWYRISVLGDELGIPGVCPLQLRHTHFVNRAMLGHNPFSIASGSGTSLGTIDSYYTLGIGGTKKLTEGDRKYLEWLMED